MADNHRPEVRSYNMSQIKSKNTKPEELVRQFLFRNGFRYRKNDSRYPGKPDIVLPKYKTVVFVNGCFWHMHDCRYFVLPKSKIDYWQPKLEKNKQRDQQTVSQLTQMGWKVIVIWECEIRTKQLQTERLTKLIAEIASE